MMPPSIQLELNFSNEPAGATSEDGNSNFEFYQQVSQDIRALLKENRDLKSRLEAVSTPAPQGDLGYAVGDRVTLIDEKPGCTHPRIYPGLDRAHCPDCKTDFSPRSSEYKSLMSASQHAPLQSELSGATPIITAPDKITQASAQVLSGATPMIIAATPIVTAPDKTPQAPAHWTETYCPARRKEHRYYRYVWMEKRRLRHRHIPGGNVRSEAARLNLLEVELAIAQGRTPQEIEQLIKSWGTSKSCA